MVLKTNVIGHSSIKQDRHKFSSRIIGSTASQEYVMAKKGTALTPKQQHFCRAVAAGCTMSDAYREAYSTSRMKPASIHREATRLMSNPMITTRIEVLNRAKDRAFIASAVSDRELVLTQLREIAAHAKGTPAEHATLRACDLLGKTVGLYKDVVETVVQRSPEEIRTEIVELYERHKDKPVH